MRVNSLKVKNFRNYSELEVEFDCKRNIIIGENAQGKTNLIEAIYISARLRVLFVRAILRISSRLERIAVTYPSKQSAKI